MLCLKFNFLPIILIVCDLSTKRGMTRVHEAFLDSLALMTDSRLCLYCKIDYEENYLHPDISSNIGLNKPLRQSILGKISFLLQTEKFYLQKLSNNEVLLLKHNFDDKTNFEHILILPILHSSLIGFIVLVGHPQHINFEMVDYIKPLIEGYRNYLVRSEDLVKNKKKFNYPNVPNIRIDAE